MRTKTLVEKELSLDQDNSDPIYSHCRNDHLNYSKYLPTKKHQSTYNKEYPTTHAQQLIQNTKIQQYRQKIAPTGLNTNLLKRSLQRSDSHFSPKNCQKLPSIISGSIYRDSYNNIQNQCIIKGKQQPTFFIKMNWHDNPSTNYQKSYQKSNRAVSPLVKAKAAQDHLIVSKNEFRGQSMYNECYSPLRKKIQVADSKDFIKNKDHLNKKGYSLHGKSQYRYKFNIQEKTNQSTMKSIPSVQKIRQKKISLLPQIQIGRKQKENNSNIVQKAPKRKVTKKTKGNPVVQDNLRDSTHKRIFGQITSN